jgi:hypothetical protein
MTSFERNRQSDCQRYGNPGVNESGRLMDRSIRKLSREEWIKSEEDASLEFEALMALAPKE